MQCAFAWQLRGLSSARLPSRSLLHDFTGALRYGCATLTAASRCLLPVLCFCTSSVLPRLPCPCSAPVCRQAWSALRRRQPARRQRALHRHAADFCAVHTGAWLSGREWVWWAGPASACRTSTRHRGCATACAAPPCLHPRPVPLPGTPAPPPTLLLRCSVPCHACSVLPACLAAGV